MVDTPHHDDARQILFELLYDQELQHGLFLLVVLELPDSSCERILRRLTALDADQDARQGLTYRDGSWRLRPPANDAP